MATKAKGKTTGEPKRFFCKECEKRVRIPKGWTRGPAVRRHYWRVHPEIMRAKRGS